MKRTCCRRRRSCSRSPPCPPPAQDKQDKRGFVWDNRPSIVFGEDINIDLTRPRAARLAPVRSRDRRRRCSTCAPLRIGLKGDLTRHFDWEIEREIDEATSKRTTSSGSSASGKTSSSNWTTFDAFAVKGGRFKMPFGLEQNTGVSDLDFAYRALGSVKIAPGRDQRRDGVRRALGRSLIYEAGVFDDDGDNGELEARPQFVAGRPGSRRRRAVVRGARRRRSVPRAAGARPPARAPTFGIAYTSSRCARRAEQPARRRTCGAIISSSAST